MQPIPFIQVGVGNRGAHVLQEILARHPERLAPVALVDVNPAFVEAARRIPELAGLPAYDSLTAGLENHPQAMAVFVVTPARFHGAMVREALQARKHVWVEKPLTYDYAEALALAELAQGQQRVVVVGNQYQYAPLERQLQRLVQSGRYGQPFLVSYIHHRHRPDMRAFTGEFPALWEQGVHSLDSILAILGGPPLRSVYALGQKPPHSEYNSHTVTNLLTEFGNGVQAHLLVTFDSQRSDREIRVECTGGGLLLAGQGWDLPAIQVLAGEQVVETVAPAPIEPEDPHRDPYAAFHAAVTSGRPAPTSIETNLQTIQWIDGAVRSLRSRSVITF